MPSHGQLALSGHRRIWAEEVWRGVQGRWQRLVVTFLFPTPRVTPGRKVPLEPKETR